MNLKKEKKLSKNDSLKDRRNFLKKAAYTAPTLLTLGTLLRPTKSMAADSWDAGPGSTNTWSGGQ